MATTKANGKAIAHSGSIDDDASKGSDRRPANVSNVMMFSDITYGPQEAEIRFRLLHFWEARVPVKKTLLGLEMLIIDDQGKDLHGTLSKDYIPFGAGATLCVGFEFAKCITAVFLHHLSRFRWSLDPKTRVLRSLKPINDVDIPTLVIQEMSKEFPSFMDTLLHERDKYMACMLLRVASEHSWILAVVGRGHLQGIKKNWNQPIKDLLEIPKNESK